MCVNLLREIEKICLMSKQVIVGKHLKTGQKCVFDTLEIASEIIGVSIATISRATMSGEEAGGWRLRRAERVYCVRLIAFRSWRVVVENGRKTGYVEFGNPLSKIRRNEVDQVKDVTGEWYL